MGLFADRRFQKDDIIGIYLGKFRKEMYEMCDAGDYGYQLSHLDGKQGLDGKHYMGMYFMNDPCLGGNGQAKACNLSQTCSINQCKGGRYFIYAKVCSPSPLLWPCL